MGCALELLANLALRAFPKREFARETGFDQHAEWRPDFVRVEFRPRTEQHRSQLKVHPIRTQISPAFGRIRGGSGADLGRAATCFFRKHGAKSRREDLPDRFREKVESVGLPDEALKSAH